MPLSDLGSPTGRGRHPNWSHPDHDACGTGFVARLGSPPSHEIIQIALNALDGEIRAAFTPDQIITPDALQGSHASLREAAQ